MKKNHLFWPTALVVVFAALAACNDPTVIGSDLLSGDGLDIQFTDTVSFTAYTEVEDSVILFDSETFLTSFDDFPVGNFDDPIFGPTKATVFSQVTFGNPPDFEAADVLDSIVLILPWNADNVYGDIDETYSLEVYELEQSLGDSMVYHSGQTYDAFATPIGDISFAPKPVDTSFMVVEPSGDTITEPQLRIPLTSELGMRFMTADSLTYTSVENFLEFFKGVEIRPASPNGGMLNFKMRSNLAGIKIYYHNDSDTSDFLFPVFSNRVVTANYEHGYAGAFVEPYIGKGAVGSDSLLFVQSMSGLNVVIEFPYAEDLDGILVNHAILELPVLDLLEDDPDLGAIDQLIVSEFIGDTSRIVINDVLSAGASFPFIFGGQVEDGVYKLNISSYFQDLIRGQASNKLQVTVFEKPEKASRVILGGPGNSDRRAKLNLTFTRY